MTTPRRILVTGSRDWTDTETIYRALRDAKVESRSHVLVHGGARGADSIAAWLARSLDYEVEPHPADWRTHGKAAGPIRNKEMVDLGADLCLAFPIGESNGTRGCMRLCEVAGIPVIAHDAAVLL